MSGGKKVNTYLDAQASRMTTRKKGPRSRPLFGLSRAVLVTDSARQTGQPGQVDFPFCASCFDSVMDSQGAKVGKINPTRTRCALRGL